MPCTAPWRSSGSLDPIRRPDLTNTHPVVDIGPFPQWREPRKIVSIDPWGHLVAETFAAEIAEGMDIRPSIAITRAQLDLVELRDALANGRIRADGAVVKANACLSAVKIAIDFAFGLKYQHLSHLLTDVFAAAQNTSDCRHQFLGRGILGKEAGGARSQSAQRELFFRINAEH